MEPTNQLVMPILIDTQDQTHVSIIRMAADHAFHATRWLNLTCNPDLESWLKSGMRKTVRRVKPTLMQRSGHESVHAIVVSSQIYVGTLKPYDAFTAFERRAQVSGWDLSRQPDAHRVLDLRVTERDFKIAVHADLTTGKAAAAAAHVATLCALDPVCWLLDYSQRFEIKIVDEIDEANSLYPIHDAGYTEVEPGTLTAALVAA